MQQVNISDTETGLAWAVCEIKVRLSHCKLQGEEKCMLQQNESYAFIKQIPKSMKTSGNDKTATGGKLPVTE